MSEGTIINGQYHDHSTVRFTIDGTEVAGVSEFSYSDNTEPGEVRGTRQLKLGSTPGMYTAEGSFTMNKRRGQELLARFGHGFYTKKFNISISYRDTDKLGLITDEIIGSTIKKAENSSSEGGDPVNMAFELDPTVIVWNGINPLEDMGGLGVVT